MLGHRNQGHDFRQAEEGGVFAKPDTGRRAHALHVAAVGRKIQVSFQNGPLVVVPLQHQRPPHLAQLAGDGGGVQSVPQAHQLHGDGGSAHAPPPRGHARHSPDQSQRIDAGVTVESPILIKYGGFAHGGRDALQRREDAVFFVPGQRHPQNPARSIRHHPRKIRPSPQVRLGRQPDGPCQPQEREQYQQREEKKASFKNGGSAPVQAADKVSSPKIASRSRLCRAVKRAIFVPFRQAAWRLGRRKLRKAGFVIILSGGSAPRKGRTAP